MGAPTAASVGLKRSFHRGRLPAGSYDRSWKRRS